MTTMANRVVINPEWTKWVAQRSSNGEVRVVCGGVMFAAPVLIVHYIGEHCYLPPAQFLKAIEEAVS
jgi:hypothetical protein